MSPGACNERGARKNYRPACALLLAVLPAIAGAEAWLEPGDLALRHHLQILIDSSILDLPGSAWPIPATDVAWAIDRIEDRDELAPRYLESLRYVESRLDRLAESPTRLAVHASGAARPLAMRTFDGTPREEGEAGFDFSAEGRRFSGRLSVSGVADPFDDKSVRFDGTYGTMRLGNWLFTAGALDRWWGPGWDGSLLLSNNARPIPALSIDRESSQAFKTPWLNWLGPWRVSALMGRMEDEREDRDHPLFFGMRVTLRPFSNLKLGPVVPLSGIEFALERTAQWCGEDLPCDAQAFWDVFAGNDNAGETVDPENEPGNQLAGWSLRYASPFPAVPFAVYRQKTGETIDLESPMPRRTLDIYGIETWGMTSGGHTWRVHFEYADTACSPRPNQDDRAFDCAYNNALFNVEGYRYRGRPIGHSVDGDSLARSLGLVVTDDSDRMASLLLRKVEVNRGGTVPDLLHSISDRPIELWNVEATVSIPTDRGSWRLGLGGDQNEDVATGRRERLVRGFLEWKATF